MRRFLRWLLRADLERARQDGREFERKILGGDAYWFSEDPVMMETLMRFARGHVEDARQYWRAARRAPMQKLLDEINKED